MLTLRKDPALAFLLFLIWSLGATYVWSTTSQNNYTNLVFSIFWVATNIMCVIIVYSWH